MSLPQSLSYNQKAFSLAQAYRITLLDKLPGVFSATQAEAAWDIGPDATYGQLLKMRKYGLLEYQGPPDKTYTKVLK